MDHHRTGETPLRVVLAAAAPSGDDRQWIALVGERWPRSLHHVNAEAVELTSLPDELESTHPPDAVVIRATGTTPPRDVRTVLDALLETGTPGVMIAPTDDAPSALWRAAKQAESDGIAVLPESLEPGRVAVALHSIVRRQPAIERAKAELALTAAANKSLRHELEAIHEELRNAAALQQSLVQGLEEEVPGLSLGAVYRPAGYVSGDVFTTERLDAEHVGIFLADVAGHGVPAALLTLFVARSLPRVEGPIDASGRRRIVPPGEALARLNRAFLNHASGSSRFATAVYAVLNTATHEIRVSAAGHPPAIIARKNHSIERIEEGGPLLGVFNDEPFTETRTRLGYGESLVLYTDGFESAFSANEGPLGREHLDRLEKTALAAADAHDAATGIHTIESMLDGSLGSLHPADDVTALIVTPTREATPSADAISIEDQAA
ncbi:MAG: PP2C family protein-serine/threonine phosphatase [Planctomycetota bacterium]